MKKGNYTLKFLNKLIAPLIVLIMGLSAQVAKAQCLPGYSSSRIDWDNLDYLVSTGTYGGFVTAAMAQTQHFTMGPNRVSFTLSADISAGENGTHTGNITNYTGDDARFLPNAANQTITISFETEVINPSFTLYDVDRSMSMSIGAANTALVPQIVNAVTYTGSIIAVGGFPIFRTLTSGGSDEANSVNTAAATINITGSVKTILLTITNVGGGGTPDFWMSDINACVSGSFPNNYFQVSRPFNGGMAGGQPAYFLNMVDDSLYITNPTNGDSKFLFTYPGPTATSKLNSCAYDPYNHIMYFVYSLTGSASTNKSLYKYDFNTETGSVITTDITTLLGIPTFNQGVESGAAAFYNGSLYFGVEASNPGRNSGREHIIWKIDFDASGNPIRSTQQVGTPSDAGGALQHDWSDFIISNGVLIDFDGAAGSPNVYHYDLMTAARTIYTPSITPRQISVLWNEAIYEVGANGNTTYESGHVQPYNMNGTFNSASSFTLMQAPGITLRGSWGDASEAFRPKSDFGDAPASYHPDPLAPATHERDLLLRLGSTYDYEWTSTASALANADGGDEDGIGAAPALNYDATLNYSINVSVFNNTGANATMIAWLDHNFNNVFDAGEGRSVNVPTSGSLQTIAINWTGIYVPLTTNVRTFLRIRLTSAANGMTTANMNGWYPNGEVEDYPVVLGAALPKDVLSIAAEKTAQSTVKVSWSAKSDLPIASYEVLRSGNNQTWEKIASVNANTAGGINNYSYTDINPIQGNSYYRVKVNYATLDNANKYTEVRAVKVDGKPMGLKLQPNPVVNRASLQFTAPANNTLVKLEVIDGNGKRVLQQTKSVDGGLNTIDIIGVSVLPQGVYTVLANINGTLLTTQFIKNQQ